MNLWGPSPLRRYRPRLITDGRVAASKWCRFQEARRHGREHTSYMTDHNDAADDEDAHLGDCEASAIRGYPQKRGLSRRPRNAPLVGRCPTLCGGALLPHTPCNAAALLWGKNHRLWTKIMPL